MNIYLIRHGESETAKDNKPDEERELTENGIQILKASAAFWKNYISHFDIILSSPLRRALQTAYILKEVFNVQAAVMKENSLLNGGLTGDLLTLAGSLELEEIAMIGHQPDLGIHIAGMTGANESNLKIPPASIAKIRFKDRPVMGKGILEFLLPPINKKG